jgi:hypothetical protein
MKFSFVTMELAPLSNIRNKSKTRIPIIPIKRINSVKGSSRLSTRDRNHTVMVSIITLHLAYKPIFELQYIMKFVYQYLLLNVVTLLKLKF